MAMWIKAKNGNVVEVDDEGLAARAIKAGHKVFIADTDAKGAKPKAGKDWTPGAEAEADGETGDAK